MKLQTVTESSAEAKCSKQGPQWT